MLSCMERIKDRESIYHRKYFPVFISFHGHGRQTVVIETVK